jgi:hypothetical protein
LLNDPSANCNAIDTLEDGKEDGKVTRNERIKSIYVSFLRRQPWGLVVVRKQGEKWYTPVIAKNCF